MNESDPSSDYVWDEIWKADSYNNADERKRRALKRVEVFKHLIRGRPLGDVVELGCGDGSLYRALRAESDLGVTSYVGIDRSPTAIARANAHLATNSTDKFVVG